MQFPKNLALKEKGIMIKASVTKREKLEYNYGACREKGQFIDVGMFSSTNPKQLGGVSEMER